MNLPKVPYYHIDSLISSGGTASVYRGIDLRSGREIALKALFPTLSKNDFMLANFRMEANHYLYLTHPNIVKLVEFVEDQGKFYLIMEYVDGVPLDVYVNTTGPMDEKTVIPLFSQLLDTIDYLHNHELAILHLDIKPNNIMVLENEQIKILDMGISAMLNEKNKNPKKCGTPAFMAPEQINQAELGPYTDIFALGVTLFNLVTGQLPFQGINHTSIFEKICNDPTPVAAEYYPNVNHAFQAIIERALKKQGRERYQSCKEFKEDLIKINYNREELPGMKKITVGRELDNTIVINDSYVGRNHLEMVQDNSGNITLTDLHSKNGTFINGKRIAGGETVSLAAIDIVRIGNTTIPWKTYFSKLSKLTVIKPDVGEIEPPPPPPPKKKPFNWRAVWQYIWRTVLSIITMLITYYIFSLLRK